jgi:hypothetical protein
MGAGGVLSRPRTFSEIMKVQKKNGQGLYLKAGNKRWKWMAGATAATAAGLTASQANATTIQLVNNYISGIAGNHLNADLTGDGNADVAITGARYSFHYRTISGRIYTSLRNSSAAVFLNGVIASAYHNDYPVFHAQVGSHISGHTSAASASVTGLIPIFFTDLHINNGKLTEGWLEVSAFAPLTSPSSGAEVRLDSLTYNTPDQGSSLALLAMGASGVLALRRLRIAQKRS